MIRVELLAMTDDALRILYTSARTCYSSEAPEDIYRKTHDTALIVPVAEEDMSKLVRKVLNSGHLSVAEHINFTFAISGISRACSHQLVRHRHASYSQKSQRYVSEKGKLFDYVVPESVKNNTKEFYYEKEDVYYSMEEHYREIMRNLSYWYDELMEAGIPAEDARMILPNACETSLTITLNLREMIHLCNVRLCSHAQWEIKDMVGKMRDVVIKTTIGEIIRPLLVPACKTCTDFRGCPNKNN